MGLDLTVRKQSDFKTDEKGRTVFTVTVLANLRNCWNIFEKLGNRLENSFDNCSTHSFHEGTFHAILKELKNELSEENNEKVLRDLTYEIEQLEEFIKSENLVEQEPTIKDEEYGTKENYGDVYEVHAWF